jgi:5-methylcytosine-specific restriction endonuclease McrA
MVNPPGMFRRVQEVGMTDELMKAAVATWATKDLPARLDVTTTAKLLGFAEHDIQVLMSSGKLVPLGDPAPNAPKWFAAVEVIRLATDPDWLHKATREISKYWRHKRERRQSGDTRSHLVCAHGGVVVNHSLP